MGIDIQKQLDLKPYNDKNIVTKPVTKEVSEQPAPQADEEKSNAAKWMIGLTATAAIVIGGLYAAKHGYLGKDAEKFAKKLFGESTKETAKATSNSAVTPTPPSTSGGGGGGNPPPDVIPVAAALVFARKGIGKLIKKPNKKLPEILEEFQKAGVKLEQKSDNILEFRTGKKPEDITKLLFNPDGTLSSIQRATKKATEEIFTFENGVLRGIKRRYENIEPVLTHKIEFNDAGKIAHETYNFRLNDIVQGELTRIENLPNSYTTGQGHWWFEGFAKNHENIPKKLRTAKIYNCIDTNYETASCITPRVCKYYRGNLKDIPSEIPSAEFVRIMHTTDNPQFKEIVDDLDVARRISQRGTAPHAKPILEKQPAQIVEFPNGQRIKKENITAQIRDFCPKDISDNEVATIAKLLEKDMGEVKEIGEEIILHAIRNYRSTLNAYGIKKPEQLEAITKPLNTCSKADIINILGGNRERVHEKLAGCFDDYGMLDVEYLSTKAGFSHVKPTMTLFDILKDIAI